MRPKIYDYTKKRDRLRPIVRRSFVPFQIPQFLTEEGNQTKKPK